MTEAAQRRPTRNSRLLGPQAAGEHEFTVRIELEADRLGAAAGDRDTGPT